MEEMVEIEQVVCCRCNLIFTPSASFDYYFEPANPNLLFCENCMRTELYSQITGSADKSHPLPIPEGYDTRVCRVGEGADTCRFCVINNNGCGCAKGTFIAVAIEQNFKNGTMTAQGDNCSGPPNFDPS